MLTAALGKIDQFENLMTGEILTSDENEKIQQVKFTYSPLGNVFQKQKKIVKEIKINKHKKLKLKENKEFEVLESVGFSEKQFPSMNDFKSKRRLTSEIINELKQNGEEEQKADRRKCIYKYVWLYKLQINTWFWLGY